MISYAEAVNLESLATPNYDYFCEQAANFFDRVDPDEVMANLTLQDLLSGSRHPTGFMVIHALSRERLEDGQLRLHIWPEGDKPLDSDTHKHPWHIASKVIRGVYSETRPQVTSLAEYGQSDFIEYQLSHKPKSYNSQDLRVTPIGPVMVEPSPDFNYMTGEVHSLPAGTYHNTKTETFSVTLALMGRVLESHSRFIRHKGATATARNQSRTMPTDLNGVWQCLREAA